VKSGSPGRWRLSSAPRTSSGTIRASGRAAAGWDGSLYLATSHFAGWYMVNELEMSSEDVAIALGHQDGGNLVRRLYGHRDKGRALDRIVCAYATRAENNPKRWGSSSVAPSQQTLFGDTYV
jgi:hypothetical protein